MAAVPSIGRATRVEGSSEHEGDRTRELYEAHANQIFRYCLHQLGSREEAEDAVQSTFLNAFRGLKRGVVPELEAAWLFKIAHNVCLSRRRSSWRRGRIESPADFEKVQELQPAPARGAEELIGLQEVLEQMPETQRRAILLREWQGLSYREIGAELELSQGAVETLIFRARRSLAAGLEEPPASRKRTLLRGADLGALAGGLKGLLLGGSTAVKVAAALAVVGATTVAAGAPALARHHHGPPVRQPARSVVPPSPAVQAVPHAPLLARTPTLPSVARLAPARLTPASAGPKAKALRQAFTSRGRSEHASHPPAPPTAKSHAQPEGGTSMASGPKAGPTAGAKRRASPPASPAAPPRHASSTGPGTKAGRTAHAPAPRAPVGAHAATAGTGRGRGKT